MNRAFKVIVVSFLFLLLAGCNSEQNEIKKVQENNQWLQKRITELKEQIEKLNSDYVLLKERYNNSITHAQELEELLYEKSLETNKPENPVVADSPNIFDPGTVRKGDIIAGMTVTNSESIYMNAKLASFYVNFEGEFTVTGNLLIDVAESGAYRITYNDEQRKKLPYVPNQGTYYIEFTNEEVFKTAAGDMLNKLTDKNPSLPTPIKIQLSNFTYNYNGKGMPNTAQFVKIIN